MNQLALSFVRRVVAPRRRPRRKASRVPHRKRPTHAARHPLHITMKLVDGLPSLREHRAHRAVRKVLDRAADRLGPRVVEYSAQANHLHLVCEADDKQALSRGMKGLAVRLARNLNRSWNRSDALFAERYHARALATPREVRNVLAYVFGNARKHGVRMRTTLDTCSSAAAFDGWVEHGPLARRWLASARTWLLAVGWRRHGPLSVLPPAPV